MAAAADHPRDPRDPASPAARSNKNNSNSSSSSSSPGARAGARAGWSGGGEDDGRVEPETETGSPGPGCRLSMSFAGCGFLGIYHLGAVLTFSRHGRGLLQRVDCFTGASAGALVASILAVRPDDDKVIEECIDFTYNLALNVHKHRLGLLTPGLSLLDELQDFLISMLPENAHLLATNRLFVSLTHSRSTRNTLVSQYHSQEDLIQCLLATSYVPHITGKKPVKRNGKKYIDGGMSDNLPIMTKGRTICVSPFSGRYDVCPQDMTGAGYHVNLNRQDFQVNYQNMVRGLHAFFPPKQVLLEKYFHRGVRDAHRFLRREKLYDDDPSCAPGLAIGGELGGGEPCGGTVGLNSVVDKETPSSTNAPTTARPENTVKSQADVAPPSGLRSAAADSSKWQYVTHL